MSEIRVNLEKRTADAVEKIKAFLEEMMLIKNNDILKDKAKDYDETVHRLKIQINEAKLGMEAAKKAFDEMQRREAQRVAEKMVALKFAEFRINILEFLISKKKLKPELKTLLEG